MNAQFYIVATPIGNYEDITLRALNTLKIVDLVLCEDTRVTGKLLKHYGINKTMFCYNDFSNEQDRDYILSKLPGQTIALVSDAGTPLISDPGYKLIRKLQEMDIKVTSIPGPCAAITALTMAGLPTDKFLFVGFLPNKSASRINALNELQNTSASLVFYESPRRLVACLIDMAKALPGRKAVVARELTKTYEEVKPGSFTELADYYSLEGVAKGEVVIVVSPIEKKISLDNFDEELLELLKSVSIKDAAAILAEQLQISKKIIYQRALELTGKK